MSSTCFHCIMFMDRLSFTFSKYDDGGKIHTLNIQICILKCDDVITDKSIKYLDVSSFSFPPMTPC
jgi:hypothetical protein